MIGADIIRRTKISTGKSDFFPIKIVYEVYKIGL